MDKVKGYKSGGQMRWAVPTLLDLPYKPTDDHSLEYGQPRLDRAKVKAIMDLVVK